MQVMTVPFMRTHVANVALGGVNAKQARAYKRCRVFRNTWIGFTASAYIHGGLLDTRPQCFDARIEVCSVQSKRSCKASRVCIGTNDASIRTVSI